MVQVNTHEAKTHLSQLLRRVANGEEVVIARAGKPIARLLPCHPPAPDRVPGQDIGKVRIAKDFDAPLPDDLLDFFDS